MGWSRLHPASRLTDSAGAPRWARHAPSLVAAEIQDLSVAGVGGVSGKAVEGVGDSGIVSAMSLPTCPESNQ